MQHTYVRTYVREFHLSNLSTKHNSLPNAPYRTVQYEKKTEEINFCRVFLQNEIKSSYRAEYFGMLNNSGYRTESFGISRIILVLYFTYVLQKHDTRVYTNLRQKYRYLYFEEQITLEYEFFFFSIYNVCTGKASK